MRDRRVLHVLPHPGGGGETYVDTLGAMAGYVFERAYLGPEPTISRALAGGVWTALREARRYDLVHVHGEVAAGLCLPAIATVPSVVTLHGLNLLRRSRGLRGLVAKANLRTFVRAARQTICVSRAERNEVLAVDRRLAGRLALIPNGVSLPPTPTKAERAAARTVLETDEASVIAIWVGALRPPKEPQTAARAVVDLAFDGVPVQLIVVGEGPLRREVEVVRTGSERIVHVLGRRTDVPTLLAAADIFVLSSRREGLPFSLLEAMSAGLPPVVMATGGADEAVGSAGFVVQPGDTDGLKAALRRLALDVDERVSLGATARERVARHYRADEMVEQTRTVYERATHGTGGA